MKAIVLDLEASFSMVTKQDGKVESDIASPYNPNNKLILAGIYDLQSEVYTSYDCSKQVSVDLLKHEIRQSGLIIGHNIKYDALWLKAIGCDLRGKQFRDTMLREYLIFQGQHQGLSLSLTAPRYGGAPKMDFVGGCFERNINTDTIPTFILAQYLYEDVMNTKIVYEGQKKRKELKEQSKYDAFYHDVMKAVIDMEYNGAAFNKAAVESVTSDIEEHLLESMQKVVDLSAKYVDKATFNPDSPQQLARIMYGLEFKHAKPTEKKAAWEDGEQHEQVKAEWAAFAARFKPFETGAQGKLDYYVEKCFNRLENSLGIKPDVTWLNSKDFLGVNGLSAGSKVIDAMLSMGKLNKKQEEFVAAVRTYSKASTAKTSNLVGMLDGVRADGFIHGQFNMSVTSTRRFSSSNPNCQNWPREGTSPVKKLITTRYPQGKIVCADYAQLEFRIAGLLSGDKLLIKDVNDGVDIHSHTATVAFGEKFTSAEGKERKDMRQKAKTKTFEFQYGAKPKTKTDQAIYDAFYGKYTRLKQWQEETISTVARNQRYVCPFTGVVFAFDNASFNNEYAWATKAVNYPIQFLADCINKCAIVGIHERTEGREDIKLILTVHDSNVLDADEGAIEEAKSILKEEMENVTKTFYKYFNKALDIPLAVDVSSGANLFNQED